MKKMMMALAALCVAGVASAVTYGWANWVGDSISEVGLDTEGTRYGIDLADVSQTADNISATGAQSAALVQGAYTVTNVSLALYGTGNWNQASDKVVGLVILDSSGNVVAVSTQTHYQFAHEEENKEFPGAGSAGSVVQTYGAAYLSFDFDGFVAKTGEEFTIQFVNTKTPSADWVGQNFDSALTSNAYNNPDGNLVANMSGDLAFRVEVQAVPEPTALALLALGVAGLALRRKAA